MSSVCVAQLVSLPEAKLLLKEDDELIKEVFDYWSRKRKNSKANTLIPTVKQEKRDGSSTSDPYVAFRRRTEKMQTRKVSCLQRPSLTSPIEGSVGPRFTPLSCLIVFRSRKREAYSSNLFNLKTKHLLYLLVL